MVASAKVYKSNTAEIETLPKDAKLIQMGTTGNGASGYFDGNGKYHNSGPRIKPLEKVVENTIEPALEYVAEQGFHIGYSSNGDGTNGGLDVSVGPVNYNTNTGPSINPYIPTQQKAPNTVPATPAAYSRTSARTATDIAQGGMTKQEVQEFNIKHPNETAQRGQ